ncbi:MAG: MarR family transcriptional regulator [Bdellovibrionales bacterium]|nr:MarR family transcriptional regulator [Bdellovibrionales bacterium]
MKKQLNRNELYLKVNQLLLRFQLKRRMIALTYGLGAEQASPALSYTEEDALFVLDSSPGMNIRDLAKFLSVERSWMSRVVSGMQKKNLILAVASNSDKRSKELKITAKGGRALKESSELLNSIMNESIKALNFSQQKKLELFLAAYANNLGASKSTPKTVKRHPIYAELWRVSNVVGILKDSFMNSGLTLTQTHVFYAIVENNDIEVFISDLAKKLPFDVSTVSRVVAEFEKEKLISRTPLKKDKRNLIVKLTNAGNKKFTDISKKVALTVGEGLSTLSDNELIEFVEILDLLTKFMPLVNTKKDAEFEFLSLDCKQAYEAASKILDVSVSKIPAETKIAFVDGGFGYYQQGTVKGIAAVKRTASSGPIDQLILVGESLSKKECLSFLQRCLEN